ncbi:MAG: hypothetical protein IPQ07_39950 [Myxococcales bacterium]|nr:hypothetical protein [Myxococcales bacterium]
MSFGEMARGVVDLAVGYFGDGHEVTVRRAAELLDTVTGERASVVLLSAAEAGDGAVMVENASGEGRLCGRLPAGLALSVEGVAGVYSLSRAVNMFAPSGGAVLTLGVSPVLAGGAEVGAAVEFGLGYVEQAGRVLLAEAVESAAVPVDGAGGSERIYTLAASGLEWAPRRGDFVLDEGREWAVEQVTAVSPGGEGNAIRYVLTVSGGGR